MDSKDRELLTQYLVTQATLVEKTDNMDKTITDIKDNHLAHMATDLKKILEEKLPSMTRRIDKNNLRLGRLFAGISIAVQFLFLLFK